MARLQLLQRFVSVTPRQGRGQGARWEHARDRPWEVGVGRGARPRGASGAAWTPCPTRQPVASWAPRLVRAGSQRPRVSAGAGVSAAGHTLLSVLRKERETAASTEAGSLPCGGGSGFQKRGWFPCERRKAETVLQELKVKRVFAPARRSARTRDPRSEGGVTPRYGQWCRCYGPGAGLASEEMLPNRTKQLRAAPLPPALEVRAALFLREAWVSAWDGCRPGCAAPATCAPGPRSPPGFIVKAPGI